MENQNSIKDIINNALKDVRNILDAETVTGQPIRLDNGITVIPVSKISMGFASGGLDLPSKNDNGDKNFGGGGGTGVTVSPIGFLTVYPEGRVEMVPITPVEMSPVEQIADMVNRAPEIIGTIRSAITGDDGEEIPEEEVNFDAGEEEEEEEDNKKTKKKKNSKK